MGQQRKWITFAVVIAAIIGGALLFNGANRAPLSHREIAAQVLAEHLRKTASPKSVVVISNPFAQQAGRGADAYTFQKASEDGLRSGFGSEVELKIAFPNLKGAAGSVHSDPNITTPMSYLVTDDAFDELVRANPKGDIFISLIGLPMNTLSMLANQKPYAFVLPDFKLLGDPNSVRHVFKSGKILAAVIPKPGAPPADKAASDYKAEFEKRFILVTPQNVDQHLPLLLR
jgi:hypothetical protein